MANVGDTVETFDVIICWVPIDTHGTPAQPPLKVEQIFLPANLSKTITWTTLAPTQLDDLGLYEIRIHVTQLQGEINLTNNHLSDGRIFVAMLGDINADRKIDMGDIITIGAAYGSIPGHSKWNLYADLNRNSRVDYWDIFLVARNFGKSY